MQKNVKFLDFLKSLKFRLIILVIAMAVIPGNVIRAGILNSYESRALSIRQSEVLTQAQIISNQIAVSEYMTGGSGQSETIRTRMNMLTTIYDGRVMIVDKAFRIIYDTYNLDYHKTIISEEVLKSLKGEQIVKYDSENLYIEMAIPIVDPSDDDGEVQGVLLISVSTDNIALNYDYLQKIAIILEIVVGFTAVFVGILCAIKLVKPFHRMSEEIKEIQTGYGNDSLEINDYSETAEICGRINDMRSQMKVMDESRQEFVSNVSHELKTPLTSMKVLADSINSMPDAPKELYQEFMEDITNEIERETKIINDLLSLVKMDKSAADLNISTVNLNELIEQILKRLQPIADRQKVELVLESFRPVTAEIDDVKMTLAITNLVENGIKYNRTDGEGWVHVTLNADHQYFYIKVEDSGIGIPEDCLDQIYERFYRVDKSHSREIGGTGLGLAITRNCILMHRGAIKAHSVLGEGTTFDVRVPLNYIA
ncbi:MAG: two-component sensor histidine kinase [Agathobacter sp.]|nr:two-component sensor histidine kinase [Agathobacter sp.]